MTPPSVSFFDYGINVDVALKKMVETSAKATQPRRHPVSPAFNIDMGHRSIKLQIIEFVNLISIFKVKYRIKRK